MGVNRKIKSDGEIHIDGTNVDIESTVDVTGDVNATGDVGGATSTITGDATVGGTLGVTGQATLSGIAYPTTDGTADQVLTTDGSGALSFADAASGGGGGADVDVIANASDATGYTGTARFINITSTADVTFTNATIEGRTITCSTSADVTFICQNFKRNTVNIIGNLHIKSQGDGTDGSTEYNATNVDKCDIKSNQCTFYAGANYDSGAMSYSDIDFYIYKCTVMSENINFNYNYSNKGNWYITTASLKCSSTKNFSSTKHVLLSSTTVDTAYIEGYFEGLRANIMSTGGTDGSNTLKLVMGSTTYINGQYPYPFTTRGDEVNTRVVVGVNTSTNQSMTGGETDVNFGTELFDPTSSFTSNQFTAKVAGYYRVSSTLFLIYNSGAWAELRLYKNSTEYSRNYHVKGDTAISNVHIADVMFLDVGDVVKVTLASGDTSYKVAGGNESRFYIDKIN